MLKNVYPKRTLSVNCPIDATDVRTIPAMAVTNDKPTPTSDGVALTDCMYPANQPPANQMLILPTPTVAYADKNGSS